MQYEDALKLWGARRIERAFASRGVKINPSTASVEMDFYEGFACCGGTNPLCYCSYAESPRAQVQIQGRDFEGGHYSTEIPAAEFDLSAVLGEIIAAADGMIHDFS